MKSDAKLLEVISRPLLVSGQLRSRKTGEVVILINSEDPPEEQLISLWHEVVHLLRLAGGHDQSEESVEAAAKKLAAACPEALEWVGLKINNCDEHQQNDCTHLDRRPAPLQRPSQDTEGGAPEDSEAPQHEGNQEP